MADRTPSRLSDAEWTVMHAVWQDHPASAREVLERTAAETGWAYTTVKTLLGRLVEKGVLSEGRRGNASLYEPRLTRSQARRAALHSLLDRAFDGTFGSLLQHMVHEEKLGGRERKQLSAMLAELEARRRRRS